ncbi:HIT family hydrolase, diadenosine tetraphosphate hydrolase [Frankia torreyi]|uniref:HIT family hydrolase, diadenosine tetraphosphate hydrolase n=1 Tax=Frankia torreyi TaxID=1856 RepID=A0A0D8B961_9ACTN|nr:MULTISPECIES: hydrolase [Frankia]KJE20798.1 HIT family hydrolase, diadenosine tetraphosphate hydrolase [Frankia torreyi]KQC35120.1 HIT family hydrolase [Frankia sp. ACN1ag]KQM03151.1 HIT family hydrolase, diadenosine tetraphosphate hydrolase [Frankia sp. CpI1-P]
MGISVASAVGENDCYSCAGNAALAGLPPRERVLIGTGWRAAHAIRTALPGWLVLVSRRHVTSPAELTEAEAAELGVLTWRLSRALVEVTGCVKTYVAAFSEAAGFEHLHIHVVPRAADLPAAAQGPDVFTFLRRPEAEWVPPAVMDDLATRLTAALGAAP